MSDEKKAESGNKFSTYATNKLRDAGYPTEGEERYGVSEDGQVGVGVAGDFLKAGVAMGEYVEYTPTIGDTEITDSSENKFITQTDLKLWRRYN